MLPEKHPLLFPLVRVYWWQIFLSFFIAENVFIMLSFLKYISGLNGWQLIF